MRFRQSKKISERNAYNMVVLMAMHGNHFNDIYGNIKTVNDIKEHYLQNGYEFKKVVSDIRDFSKRIPVYENLIGSQTFIQGVTVSKQSHITGEFEQVISGDGTYNDKDYWANFDISHEDFELAITSGKLERLLSAVNAGIASIEAYLNLKYMQFYRVSSDAPSLRDPLEEKIKNWPKIFTGASIDLSTRSWASFVAMKKLRDESFQHRKTVSSGILAIKHLKLLNMYKLAIPKFLLELHIHFSEKCPSSIIRYVFYPEINIVKENNA